MSHKVPNPLGNNSTLINLANLERERVLIFAFILENHKKKKDIKILCSVCISPIYIQYKTESIFLTDDGHITKD